MKETLSEINAMQAAGIIGEYAIGGAVGATFYIEPAATIDIDIFVSFTQNTSSSLISLGPIYSYLSPRGHRIEGEYIVIFGWPVQFLPPGSPLATEALERAVGTDVDGVPTRVMTAEHLAAIALDLGRPKDWIRLLQFLESGALDPLAFDEIVSKFGLTDKWTRFRERFLT